MDLSTTGPPAAVGNGGAPRSGDGFVFISYARRDAKAAAAVVRLLEGAGFPVWWDGLIPGGERFGPLISDALERSRAVVVLWSRASIDSHWVQDEATRGLDRKCLVPLSLDGTEPPLGFRQFQSLDVSGGLTRANPQVERGLATLSSLFERAAPAPPPLPRFAPLLAPARRRSALLGAGVIAAAAAGYGAWRLFGDADRRANSIAVLPFENLSGDATQQYLSDGIAAEVRGKLARNPALQVVGQVSSNRFRVRGEDSAAIARRLGVANLLDGNIRVAGGRARIGVELIAGATGFSRWSGTYERPLGNVLKLQEDIAEAVDAALTPRFAIGGAEPTRRSGGTEIDAAFDAYLRGKELFDAQRDEASDRGALAHFTEAVRLDPAYAAARAARALAMAVVANSWARMAERRRLYADAADEARQAIAAAGEFAPGYAALGYVLLNGQLDPRAAQAPFENALRFGAGNVDVLSRYAVYRARRREFDQAVPQIARAITLDPLNSGVFRAQGLIRFASGDYPGAIASQRRALEIDPDRATLHGYIGDALLMLGRVEEAAGEYGRERSTLLALPGKAFVALRRHDEAGARAAFAALVRQEGDNSHYQQAQILAQWGRTGEALDALERARAEQDSGLVYVYNDPFLAPLRDQPRFKALLSALHFA